ncbi:site-specific integrase [Halorarum salinum]|uniref:Tyrosine-type recombinase/integrase n=1 Tax=Halorarum salinum TaxID=2743089 RepID=A0A7D5LBZ3_9EURY|nr:site-specific integrase [Halobaculum salinum]QLG62867.1 tyrosine-type recombinase/integrase [Halobaculum salinum]
MGNLEDFQNFGRQLRKELDAVDDHDEVDRPYIKRFVTAIDGHVAESTLAVYLRNLRRVSDLTDEPLIDLDEAGLDSYVFDWRRDPALGQGDDPGFSEGTIRNYQFAVTKFLDTIDVEAEWVEDYDLVAPPQNNVEPEDMLTPEDVAALAEGANNLRDIALIEFLADTGARLSLVGSLRVGDVDLEGVRATYSPNPNATGLKGATVMSYPIIDSKTILQTYLRSTHPRPEREDVAFFHRIGGNHNTDEDDAGAISPQNIRGQLRKAADHAGIDKPVNPHNFRHSAITRMRREGWDRGEIEHRVHWSVDTDMWATYEHISGEQHNEAIWRHAGIVEEDEDGPDRQRIPCPNCREPLAPGHQYCNRCGEPADGATRRLKQQAIGSLADAMADLSEQERRAFLSESLQRLDEDASMLGAHESPSQQSDS